MADKQFSDSFTFLPQGGIIQEFKVAGTNVVLGFPSAESYRTKHNPFFGENIGRVANRISGAKINSLNGKSYDLAVNNGPNTLHGGAVGWGKKDFEGPTPVNRNGKESVMFKYLSKDGVDSFPAQLSPFIGPNMQNRSHEMFQRLLVPSRPDFPSLQTVSLSGFQFNVIVMQSLLLGLASTLLTHTMPSEHSPKTLLLPPSDSPESKSTAYVSKT
jgi:hypothetical protein